MSIEKRRGMWTYRFRIDGKEHRASTGLPATRDNKAEAEKIAARREAEEQALWEERNSGRDNPLFLDAAAKFLNWCEVSEYRPKPGKTVSSTALRIRTSFASIADFFGDFRVSDIKAGDVEDYKVKRIEVNQVKDVTLRHDLQNLSLFFQYAMKKEWIDHNPVDRVTKPSDKDSFREHILTAEEEEKYFAAATGTVRDVARLILLQGCRPEEIMGLRPSDIDLANETMTIQGGKSRAARRKLHLTGESIAILEQRMKDADRWLFPSPRDAQKHVVQLNNMHDRACREAGVSFRLYDLRHTCLTRLVTEAGVDIATAAAIAGHSGLRIIQRYVHPTEETQKAAMKRYDRMVRPRLKVV